MSEKEIEKYLVRKVKLSGGMSYKFVSPGNAGVPDRIVLLPNGAMFFIELKSPKGKVRPIQRNQIDRILAMGQMVYVADSVEKIDAIINQEIADGKV